MKQLRREAVALGKRKRLFGDGRTILGNELRTHRKDQHRSTTPVFWTKARKAVAEERAEANNARIVDRRDKTNWAHGKMQRAGVYATRKRT